MASQSTSNVGEPMADEVQELMNELARLQEYKAVAEYNLEQMGLDLEAAQKQGWVSKRAKVRRARVEKKKATHAARWAEVNSNRQWLREKRKKLGLPVHDPTPTPSEAAYIDRVAEAKAKEGAEKLRNRVRRLSHQLLLAAAIGKQYREATLADHSGHNAPGANPATVLAYKPFDARSDTSMSTTEAMARSFRNWANREKTNRFRPRSHSPSTVVASSRTTGPEDTPSGSSSDSSFTDDYADGVLGALALVNGSGFPDEDDSDFDDDDEEGLTSLSLGDISDEIKATAGAMLATAEDSADNQGDWADKLAKYVADILTTPSDDDLIALGKSFEAVIKSIQIPPNPKGAADKYSSKKNKKTAKKITKTNKTNVSGFPTWYEMNHGIKTEEEAIAEMKKQEQKNKKASKLLKWERRQKRKQKRLASLPKSSKPKSKKRSSRKPNRPAAPDQSVWDPTWWQVNTEDPDDGAWAGKSEARTQPTDDVETGFVTWAEQEKRFPRLDERLRLHEIPPMNPIIFDPAMADTHAWDPINRAITEPKTGKREPLHLNPVTMHSLGRWSEYGYVPSKVPVQMPDNPPTEVKKRPLSSVTFSMGANSQNKKAAGSSLLGGANGNAKKVSFTLTETTKTEPVDFTNPSAAVASVHYPLKSPTAQSISKSQPGGQHDAQTYPVGGVFSTVSGLRTPSGPPTPYPRGPDTPTVALYNHGGIYSLGGGDATALKESELRELERDQRLAAFVQGFRTDGKGKGNSKNDNGKRPATPRVPVEPPSLVKRRKTGASDREKENTAKVASIVKTPKVADAAKKEGLDLGLARKYDEEELQTAHPSLMSEYVAARAALERSAGYPTTTVHKAAAVRFEAARSRLKAALNEESAQKSAQVWQVGRARDAVDAEVKKPLWDQQVHPLSSLVRPKAVGDGQNKNKHLWEQQQAYPLSSLARPRPVGGDGEKKSVRFELQREGGPSDGMRDGARRALGRYGATSSRRGMLGPFR
ncbi:hypothetical protein E0Z10_g4450 [Xylaria hypoxylon]|uniref:Uncharacterized protein n=1 Tax=Xylaria hypoxylon TaxID=37992 RepID=A0A4Z0YWL2_9PEZI|nr:hypothetical protein E0Z10_g4450 [Xylaria hypoxylon]